jgi:predicted TIM-barrel fold metal-dependent hydrolase
MRDSPEWTRRSFLAASGIGVLAAVADPCRAAFGQDESPPIIDCHAHVNSEDQKKYPAVGKPSRPHAAKGTVDHLRREALQVRGEGLSAGVRFVTSIHDRARYGWDNKFTADAARDNKDFMVGVLTLNPDDPASPKALEEYVKSYNVRGLQSIPAKSGKLDDPGVAALWKTAEQLGIVVNVLTNADKQAEIEALARRHHGLRIVIDHCLNIKAGPMLEPTLAAMRALAALPNMHAKLSFIPAGSAEEFPFRDMHEPCREVIKTFGPERCVWGSCFPCELGCPKATYEQHLQLFTSSLDLDDKVRRTILGQTAQRLWFPQIAGMKRQVPQFTESWSILLEGFGGTPHDRTWFRASLDSDGTMHAGRSRRAFYRTICQGKVTDDEVKHFYTATARIIAGSPESRPYGRTEDGWNWTVQISSATLTAEKRYAGHSELVRGDPGFVELQKIITANSKSDKEFPE